ncbi:MAG: hypothetical protein ACRYFZ_22255 [Janthinobacterium lividum]
MLTRALLVFGLLAAGSFSVHAQSQFPIPAAFARPTVRPLTRYLAAMLRLSPKQAAAVQQALRNRPDHTLAPEDLTASLSPVLSLDAQERLLSLQGNATTYRALYYLAAQH